MGIKRTSIASVCQQAGLSAGALYVHFRNKDEIIAEALQFGAMTETMLPRSWAEFKAQITNLERQTGFDVATAARARLQLYAECVHPGPLHDMLKPQIERSRDVLVQYLRTMVDEGKIRLVMSPLQTALAIASLIDGLLWIALSSDRPLDELREDLSAGLDCFVTAVDP